MIEFALCLERLHRRWLDKALLERQSGIEPPLWEACQHSPWNAWWYIKDSKTGAREARLMDGGVMFFQDVWVGCMSFKAEPDWRDTIWIYSKSEFDSDEVKMRSRRGRDLELEHWLISVSGKTCLNNASRYRSALILWHWFRPRPYLCSPMLLRSSTRASLSQQLATRFSYTWVHRHSSMLRPLAHTPIYSTADEYVEDSEPERVELRKKQRKTTSQRGATKCFAEESKHSRPPTSSKPHQAEQRTSVIEISGALSLPCFFVNLAFINASNRRLRLR